MMVTDTFVIRVRIKIVGTKLLISKLSTYCLRKQRRLYCISIWNTRGNLWKTFRAIVDVWISFVLFAGALYYSDQ